MFDRFSRQSELLNMPKVAQTPISIIGCGAIGSNTAAVLARSGFTDVTMYDPDMLELSNVTAGIFDARGLTLTSKPKPKVEKLASAIKFLTGEEYNGICQPVGADGIQKIETTIAIVGVDSLDIRRDLWESGTFDDGVELLIDGRMGGHACTVFSVDMDDHRSRENYAVTLSADPEPLPCGQKATAYVQNIVSAMIAYCVVSFVNGWFPIKPVQLFDGSNGIGQYVIP